LRKRSGNEREKNAGEQRQFHGGALSPSEIAQEMKSGWKNPTNWRDPGEPTAEDFDGFQMSHVSDWFQPSPRTARIPSHPPLYS
jgi:hypothetical protein